MLTTRATPTDTQAHQLIAGEISQTCICIKVRQLCRIITRVYGDALRPLDITSSQLTLLGQIAYQNSPISVEIGRALDIEKSTLARNLKRLLALGYMTMDPPAGRRGRGLHLTPQGEEVLKKAWPLWRKANDKVLAALGAGNVTHLNEIVAAAEGLTW